MQIPNIVNFEINFLVHILHSINLFEHYYLLNYESDVQTS